MVDDGSSDARRAAIEALGSIGGDQAVKLLQEKLANGSREDSMMAAVALAKTGDAGARQTLIDATTSGKYVQQVAALRALGHVDGEDVRTAMTAALHSSDPNIVAATTGWFSSHGDHAAVKEIVGVLKSAPAEAQGSLVSALAGIGGDDARDALATTHARTPGDAQASALTQLAGMANGRDEARKIALSAAKEGGQGAVTAITILGQDGSREARDALVSIARAGSPAAEQAISSLAQNGDPDARRALVDLTRNAKTPQLSRRCATWRSPRTGDPSTSPTFVAAARDKDFAVRRAAITGLGRIGGADAERALVDATNANDSATSIMAVHSLGSIHSATSNAQFEKLASDPDSGVRRAAYSQLVSKARPTTLPRSRIAR